MIYLLQINIHHLTTNSFRSIIQFLQCILSERIPNSTHIVKVWSIAEGIDSTNTLKHNTQCSTCSGVISKESLEIIVPLNRVDVLHAVIADISIDLEQKLLHMTTDLPLRNILSFRNQEVGSHYKAPRKICILRYFLNKGLTLIMNCCYKTFNEFIILFGLILIVLCGLTRDFSILITRGDIFTNTIELLNCSLNYYITHTAVSACKIIKRSSFDILR